MNDLLPSSYSGVVAEDTVLVRSACKDGKNNLSKLGGFRRLEAEHSEAGYHSSHTQSSRCYNSITKPSENKLQDESQDFVSLCAPEKYISSA